jgi:hypothetical protein
MEFLGRKVPLCTLFGEVLTEMLLKAEGKIWRKGKMEHNQESVQEGRVNF